MQIAGKLKTKNLAYKKRVLENNTSKINVVFENINREK
jgi:hypothetical protein